MDKQYINNQSNVQLPVVWAEGMCLGQQHFQQWDRFLRQQDSQYYTISQPYYWGLDRLQINLAALQTNQFVIEQLQLVLGSGELLTWPEENGSLSLNLPTDGESSLIIELVIANNHAVTDITAYTKQNNQARWHAVYRNCFDQYDMQREREVCLAYPNFSLRVITSDSNSDTEYSTAKDSTNSQYSYVPIMRLLKQQTAYVIDEQFVPATLNLHSVIGFKSMQAKLLDNLSAWLQILQQQQNKSADIIIAITETQRLLTNIRMLICMPRLHPCLLYNKLYEYLNLISVLLNIEVAKIAYQHENLSSCFAELMLSLENMCKHKLAGAWHEITLHKEINNYVSGVISQVDLESNQLVLAIRGQQLQESTISSFVSQCVIASPDEIEQHLRACVTGVKLIYSPNKQLVNNASAMQYLFILDKNSAAWKAIVKTQHIAVHIPKSIMPVNLKLYLKP